MKTTQQTMLDNVVANEARQRAAFSTGHGRSRNFAESALAILHAFASTASGSIPAMAVSTAAASALIVASQSV